MDQDEIDRALRHIGTMLKGAHSFVFAAEGSGGFVLFHDCSMPHALGLLELGKAQVMHNVTLAQEAHGLENGDENGDEKPDNNNKGQQTH